MPKVTFLAPVYNKESWIVDSIESMRGQTLKDIEILFVDDGSTDATKTIISLYQKVDPRIRLISLKKNVGLGKAWNIGTKEVKSPIICVASGDDLWIPERAEISYKAFLNKPKTDVFYGGFYFCKSTMEPTEHKPAIPFSAKKMLEPRKDGFCPQYIGHFVMAYKTSIAKAVPYREYLKVGVDYPFLVDLVNKKARFGWTNKTLGYARVLKSGVSISRRKEVEKASA